MATTIRKRGEPSNFAFLSRKLKIMIVIKRENSFEIMERRKGMFPSLLNVFAKNKREFIPFSSSTGVSFLHKCDLKWLGLFLYVFFLFEQKENES